MFSRLRLSRLAQRARPPCGGLLRPWGGRLLSTAPEQAARGVSVPMMAAGMLVAAGGGIGIGMVMPAHWLDFSGEGAEEKAEAAPSASAAADDDSAVVHENVRDIAEDIPRPAIIVDATRAQVESLYEFHSCIASSGMPMSSCLSPSVPLQALDLPVEPIECLPDPRTEEAFQRLVPACRARPAPR